MFDNDRQSTERYMLTVKDAAHALFRVHWKSRPGTLPHDLLLELKFGSHLEYLSHLVFYIRTGSDLNDYKVWSRRLDVDRHQIEMQVKQDQREEIKEST